MNMTSLKTMIIWGLISFQGFVLLFDTDQRGKFYSTVANCKILLYQSLSILRFFVGDYC